jgi:hypothetical protein
MSMTTMSGFSSAAIATASAALPAVPTQSRSGSEESANDSRSANVLWSSTTSTRSEVAPVSPTASPTDLVMPHRLPIRRRSPDSLR